MDVWVKMVGQEMFVIADSSSGGIGYGRASHVTNPMTLTSNIVIFRTKIPSKD